MLYRKYRPQKFEEIFGQEPIIRTLRNSLEQDKVGHAYLFAGPRGTGKTSVARILAGQLGVVGLDLIEIDAASNRGIDDVRALRDQISFLPTRGSKKLYILDEAHMLTSEAFNALLKTLEEPPEHVHFVLCTTEPYKLPATIISRCQRFDFSLADERTLTEYLQFMAGQEKIGLETEAVKLLVESAQGSFRDALVLLEKVAIGRGVDRGQELEDGRKKSRKISAKMIREILGLANEVQVVRFAELAYQKKSQEALALIKELNESGVEMKSFVKRVIKELRKKLLADSAKAGENADELIDLIVALIGVSGEIRNAPVASLPLEMMVVGWGRGRKNPKSKIQNPKSDTHSAKATQGVPDERRSPRSAVSGTSPLGTFSRPEPSAHPHAGDRVALTATATTESSLGLESSEAVTSELLLQAWGRVLEQIKPHNHSVEALLRGCQPVALEDGILTLQFLYQFHRERIAEAPNRQLVEEVVSEVLDQKVRIKCVMGRGDSRERPRKTLGDAFSKNAVDDAGKIPKDNSRVAALARRAPEDLGDSKVKEGAAAQSFRGKVSSGFAGEVPAVRVSDQAGNDDKDLLKLAHEVLGGEIIE